jgi:hypothetical protein
VSFVLLEAGFLTVTIRHSLLKNGVYFYYRRIPDDVRSHFGGKLHRRVSLKTKEAHVAAKRLRLLLLLMMHCGPHCGHQRLKSWV